MEHTEEAKISGKTNDTTVRKSRMGNIKNSSGEIKIMFSNFWNHHQIEPQSIFYDSSY